MARLTCYHCHITCWLSQKIGFMQVVIPRTTPIVAGVYFLTAKTKIHSKPFRSKLPFSPVLIRPRGKFKSQSYPLSINTRIARARLLKNCSYFQPAKTAQPNPLTPISSTDFHPDFVNNKNRPTGGWPHCVTPTTIPSVFSVPSSITKSEPQRGPHDFLFDEFWNGER